MTEEIVQDKLEYYRACIQALLEEHSQYKSREQDVENELLFDSVRDRYQFMRVGWKGLQRVYYIILHFDIKEGKIWLQQNTTDVDVGQELLDMGIPKEDIVLGLHPPYKRPYTGYGVA
ncbi:MAG: XisI protein [Cyanobacteriota bacterium]|nr:XisI protein [Cyanobacteriota bacterium]